MKRLSSEMKLSRLKMRRLRSRRIGNNSKKTKREPGLNLTLNWKTTNLK